MVKLRYSKDKTRIEIFDPLKVNPYNKGIVASFNKVEKEGQIQKDILRNSETSFKSITAWKSAVEKKYKVKLPEL